MNEDMFVQDGDDQPKTQLDKALETKAMLNRTLDEWRSQGKFDYPLTDEGLVARLEDARDMTKILSNAVLQFCDDPEVMMVMMLIDPIRFKFVVQAAALAHMMSCSDPECGIKYPEKGAA
ncbi:MAG: hypothetical protein KGL39_47860 [Patescibacteria group bacterium]|nr:hypothetical protein [Patescibacteria group bacterium]